MKQRGPIPKTFALTLAFALSTLCIPTVSAQESATLSGTILNGGGEAPLTGALVHAGDLRTGEVYSSTLTDADGGFTLSDLPAAAYELAVERDGGLFLVGSPVQLAPGETRAVSVAINAQAAPDPATATGRGNRGFWDKPLFATLAVVGGAFLIGALISSADDDDEGLASPFTN